MNVSPPLPAERQETLPGLARRGLRLANPCQSGAVFLKHEPDDGTVCMARDHTLTRGAAEKRNMANFFGVSAGIKVCSTKKTPLELTAW